MDQAKTREEIPLLAIEFAHSDKPRRLGKRFAEMSGGQTDGDLRDTATAWPPGPSCSRQSRARPYFLATGSGMPIAAISICMSSHTSRLAAGFRNK